MKLVAFTCPSCSAHLDVDIDKKTATCQYCGATFPVEDETQHIQFDGAEQAGYEFEKGRQKAQAEAQQPMVLPVTQYEPVKKRKTWLWVLGWICIFPVPLTLIMLKKKNLNPKIRYGIIAAAWLIYLAIGFGGGSGESNSSATDSGSSAAETQELASDETVDESAVSDVDLGDTSNALTIQLISGQENEYSEERTLNAGTEFEETQLVYYVPAGEYEVTNTGQYRSQVNVYEGVTVNEDGWEEVANTGDIILLDPDETGEITVPEGYYIDIFDGQLELVQK